MPVQVPSPVQRFEPQQPTQIAPIQYKAQDNTQNLAQEQKATERLGTTVVGMIQHAEDSEIDTEVTKSVNDFEINHRQRMAQAKASQENPTDLYAGFDEETNKTYDDIVTNSKLGVRGQEILRQRLSNKANQLELQKISQYGVQNNKYQEAVFTTATDNSKRMIVDSAALVNASDEKSLTAIDQGVNELINLHIRQGIKTGGVVSDEKGEMTYFSESGGKQRVAVGPITNAKMKEDLSGAIYNAMDLLIKSDNIEAANLVKGKYGEYLMPEKKRQIEDDFVKADNKQLAYKAARDPKVLDKISDPTRRDEVGDMARKIKDDRASSQEREMKRYNEQNRDAVLRVIQDRARAGQPIATLTEMENDPKIKFAISRIKDPKMRQEIDDAVVQPKKSSVTAKARVMDLLSGKPDESGRTVFQYSNEEKIAALNGLSTGDRRKAETQMGGLFTETGAQTAAKNARADKYFLESAKALNLVKEDKYDGKIKGAEYDKFVAMKDEFMAEIYALPPGTSDDVIRKTAKDWAAAKKKGEVYKTVDTFQGARTLVKNAPPPGAGQALPLEKEFEWRKKFFDRNGRGAKRGTTELQDFIKSESSK